MTRDELIRSLQELGVPSDLLTDFPAVPSDVEAMLVYGSQARGDAVMDSDLDMLALASASRPTTRSGAVNISFYTREQLSTGIGTLFGAHLKRDAKILWDDHGHLTSAVGSMGEVDSDRLLERVRRMSELFTTLERDLPKYCLGLTRQARYLLRSCMYAIAIAEGDPCFSVRELASRHRDPELTQLLASRRSGDGCNDDLGECLARLKKITGEFPSSRNGSLEATIVNEWGRPSDLLSMAFMALGLAGDGSDYAEVEKILL